METERLFQQQTTNLLQGSLEAMSLLDLLASFDASRKSGILMLEYPSGTQAQLSLQDGRLGGAISPMLPPWSETLRRMGVSESTLERTKASGSGPREILSRLIAEGQLNEELFRSSLSHRMLATLIPLLSESGGEFAFVASQKPVGYLAPGVAISGLLLEATRRVDELRHMGRTLYPNTRFQLTANVGDFGSRVETLSAGAWQVLAQFAEPRRLVEVARKLDLLWDELVRRVLELESLGLIRDSESRHTSPTKVPFSRTHRLEEGNMAPAFSLPGMYRDTVSLGSYRGKRLLLAFFRFAGCPFCNLRVRELSQAYPQLRESGIDVLGIFGSELASIRQYAGRQDAPFDLLADPDDKVHELYGVERSLLRVMHPTAMNKMREGLRLETVGGSWDGEMTRMPAEFLINPDLSIAQAYYSSHPADRMPIEQMLRWVSHP